MATRWRSSRAGTSGPRGPSRPSMRRSASSPSSRARVSRSYTPARPPGSMRAGSASSIRPCSRVPGASSSSTWRALFAEVPERILYEDVVTYPALRQDLAFVVDEEIPAGELVQLLRDSAGPELREARVFDVYRGGQIPAGQEVRRDPGCVPVAGANALRRGRPGDPRPHRGGARRRRRRRAAGLALLDG